MDTLVRHDICLLDSLEKRFVIVTRGIPSLDDMVKNLPGDLLKYRASKCLEESGQINSIAVKILRDTYHRPGLWAVARVGHERTVLEILVLDEHVYPELGDWFNQRVSNATVPFFVSPIVESVPNLRHYILLVRQALNALKQPTQPRHVAMLIRPPLVIHLAAQ